MNDLNSVFLVGKIKEILPNKIILTSKRQVFEEIEKEYVTSETNFFVFLNKDKNTKKMKKYLKPGMRIGVNGYLRYKDEMLGVHAHTIQFLEHQ